MWLGTDLVFEAFTFHIVETEYGVFQIHAYPYDETMSTFIVETDEETWRRAGLDAREALAFAPGENDEDEHRVLPRAVRRHPRRPHARRATTRAG